MVCKKCNNFRIFLEDGKIICPTCEKIYGISENKIIANQIIKDQDLLKIQIFEEIRNIRYLELRNDLILRREIISQSLLKDIKNHHEEISAWFKISLLIDFIMEIDTNNFDEGKKPSKSIDLDVLSKKIKKYYENELILYRLQKGEIIVTGNQDSFEVFETEKSSIINMKDLQGNDKLLWYLEQEQFFDSFNFELNLLLISELFQRYFRKYGYCRVLNNLDSRKATKYYLVLEFIICNHQSLGSTYLKTQDTVLCNKFSLTGLRDALLREFDKTDVDDFFQYFIQNTLKNSRHENFI